MGLFTKTPKDTATKTDPSIMADIARQHADMEEDIDIRGMSTAIDNAVQKQFDNLQHFENDQAGMFGNEFAIQSTAARFKSAYTREPWMWAAANLIARTLMTVDYKVVNKETKEEINDHEVFDRLHCGNSVQGPKAIEWATALDFVLGGSYLIVYNEDFTECEHIPVERFSPIIEESEDTKCNSISGFQITSECGKNSWIVPAKQAIYTMFPNPYSPFYGMSLFTAASRPIILDRVKNEFELAYYLRGATLTGVIESSEDINKSRLKLLMKSFEALFTGKRNWHRQQILPKGLTWKSAGSSFSDMKHIEGLRENRLSMLAALAVPPSKVGLTGDVNRATAEQQDKDFWINLIKPLAVFQADCLNRTPLAKTFLKPGEVIVPDFSEVKALQGSVISKGEEATSVEKFWSLDEIRLNIFGMDPLPPGVKPAATDAAPQGAPSMFLSAAEDIEKKSSTSNPLALIKSQVTASQERIAASLADAYREKYDAYIQKKLDIVIAALKTGKSPKTALNSNDLSDEYNEDVLPILTQALERGFSFSNTQSKTLSLSRTRQKMPTLKFSKIDQEAIDLLRLENQAGQRALLAERSIESFKGFNELRSKQMLDLVAEGKEAGLTNVQISSNIREQYGEQYANQANTVVRTEILTAVSQGVNNHKEVLEQVFTEVQKQWLHVGDSGDHIRENHVGFEDMGPVEASFEYADGLQFPRAPGADPSETINCRCSIVNLVPEDAESNAEEILNG